MDDSLAFQQAIEAANYDMRCTIGTLREKTLHLVLKNYFAPDRANHEIPIRNYIVDAVTEEGVFEIQTRGLSRLKPKLTTLLEVCPVTVVYPIVESKWVCTVDTNGQLRARRKSPKHEHLWTQMRELYTLRNFVDNPRFRICLCAVELEEYRVAKDGNRRRTEYEKLDRVPTALLNVQMLASPHDYFALLPTGLPERFTVETVAQAGGHAADAARMLLGILERMGVVERCGKIERKMAWRIASPFVSNATGG